MRRCKYTPFLKGDRPADPFDSAEEAWFWYVRCQKLRWEGARLRERGPASARPCDPDDVYRAVIALARGGRIGRAHLGVLDRFGVADRPPDPRAHEEEKAARLWSEALDGLTTVLRRKGVVATPEPRGESSGKARQSADEREEEARK